jgi:prepilin-type processing-associated H-X9-DG protein
MFLARGYSQIQPWIPDNLLWGLLAILSTVIVVGIIIAIQILRKKTVFILLRGGALLLALLGIVVLSYIQLIWGRGIIRLYEEKRFALCTSKLRNVSAELLSGDNNLKLDQWVAIRESQDISRDIPCYFAINKYLIGIGPDNVTAPDRTIMLFEVDAKRDSIGTNKLLRKSPKWIGGDNYGFADGHVQWLPRKKLPDGTWAKEPEADWVIWDPKVKQEAGEKGP